ncbi:MAG TPA: alpha-L-fucosidase [Chthonomonadales bacterium]|nr:alpha-L-fucosidase [Chthonomonadales bacterium]
MVRPWLCLSLAFVLAGVAAPSIAVPRAADAQETAAERDRRMSWFREARFGLFIHWGLYALPAGEWNGRTIPGIGEWIMYNARIPVDQYEPLARQFNPVRFNARAWARMARAAGMRYVVITSKHHDGFSLFDARNSTYDVMATPFGRDVIRELAAACRAEGLRFGVYYSIMDWHHPDYLPRRPWDTRPAEGANFDRYVEYMKDHLRQLVQDYGPLAVLWFDGEWEPTWTHERGQDLYRFVRGLQPNILVNNRVDKGRQGMQGMTRPGAYAGDFGTPEQEVPATGLPGVDWESCMTMNDTWGFRKDDHNWKSTPTLIRMLVDVVSKGGNLLLNVGPTAEGLIPEPSVERLAAIGRWMATNRESIHGCGPSGLPQPAWGRTTARPGRLYLHVFDWPADRRVTVPYPEGGVTRVVALAARRTPIRWTREGGNLVVELPAAPLDPVNTVIAIHTRRR